MRLWTIHPQYLDPQGLVALWREGLLAQKVLADQTRGYRNHPQLHRFKNCKDPRAAIAAYLNIVLREAVERGYAFDASKIEIISRCALITVTQGQVQYEFEHLRRKLWKRNRSYHKQLCLLDQPVLHPSFKVVEGGIEEWERF